MTSPTRKIVRVISSGSIERYIDPETIVRLPNNLAMARVVEPGSCMTGSDSMTRVISSDSMTRVISSGSIEKFLSPVELSKQPSYCSLADLQNSEYAFSMSELNRLLEPHQQPPASFQPTLATIPWEYVRNPRRPDSATSNSLRSRDSDDGDDGDADAMSEEEAVDADAGSTLEAATHAMESRRLTKPAFSDAAAAAVHSGSMDGSRTVPKMRDCVSYITRRSAQRFFPMYWSTFEMNTRMAARRRPQPLLPVDLSQK